MERSKAMYGTAVRNEPTVAELEAAHLGFLQMLRRKRFSGRFIELHAEDLLARARFEYSRARVRGEEIRSPAGWLIHCAWRRTQNLLEAQSIEPTFVAEEAVGVIVDEGSPTPEQAAIDDDRAERIAAAVAELSVEQRTLIELSYFEGMSVREAGRFLHWHSSKAQRCHEAALRRLREILGIEDVDALGIEIGLAAWVSVSGARAGGVHLPGGVEALAEAGGRAASGFWQRANDLARRFALGGVGEPSSAAAAGNVARTAGVCGAAAVACLASGVVGSGVGGVGLSGGGGAQQRPAPIERRAGAEAAQASTEYVPSEVTAEAPAQGTGKFAAGGRPEEEGAAAPSEVTAAPEGQAEAEFSPFAGEASDASAPPPPSPVEPTRSASSGSSGGSASASASASADGEFGAFK